MPDGQTRQKVRKKTEPFAIHYANSVEMEVSPWDFKMYFGQIEEASETRLSILESVAVYMSPQHAKVFANILADNVRKYETTFGRIPTPPRGDFPNGKEEEAQP